MEKKTFIILILPALALVVGFIIKETMATSNPHSWDNGLIGYWSFDGQNTTSTGTRDMSGNDNWGSISGATPIAGIVGQALSFDGVNDYVNCGNDNSISQEFDELTVLFWTKKIANPVGETYANILSKGYTLSAAAGSYEFIQYLNTIYWGTIDTNSALRLSSTALGTEWIMITGTFKINDYQRLYKNAVFISQTATGSYPIKDSGYGLWIGKNSQQNAYRYDGLIDEVRIYNRALSAEEIMQHYEQTRRNVQINQPTISGLVAWWKMDEKVGSIAYDSTTNNYDKAIVGATLGADGKISSAFSFDGSDYINTGLNQAQPYSVSFWVYPTATDKYILGGTVWTTSYTYFRYGTNSFNWHWRKDAGTSDSKTTAANFPINNWYFITMTVDSSDNYIIYVDGVNEAEKNSPTNYGSWLNAMVIGGIGSNSVISGSFVGTIDDFRIYNRALSATEVLSSYRAGAAILKIATANPHDWSDGLVGYWTMNGQDISGTTLNDKSGEGNNGTISGAVGKAGIVGQALSFDGVDDYVIITGVTASTPHTIELWIKTPSVAASEHILDSGTGRVIMGWGGGGTNFKYYDGVSWLDSGVNILDNQWHHIVAVTPSSGDLTLCVDGSCTDVTPTNNNAIGGYVTIGSRNGLGQWYNGLIDEVRIYNRALSAEEVKMHYDQTRRNLSL